MMNKKKLTKVAIDNDEFVKSSKIPIPETIKVQYDSILCKKCLVGKTTKVMFAEMKTDDCVRYCINNGLSKNIVAANFASRRHRCGGYKRGSKAQEENWCRVSPQLPASYEGITYPWEETSVLITPNIKILRNNINFEFFEEKDIVTTGIVAMAAQNLKEEKFDQVVTTNTLINAFCSVKRYLPNTDVLVLGAWGCGAFCNDAYTMAKIMNFVNKNYGGLYKYIIYAIPEGPNLGEFRETIELFNNDDNKELTNKEESDEDEGDDGEKVVVAKKPTAKSDSDEPDEEDFAHAVRVTNHRKGNRKDNHRDKYALAEED